MSVPSTIFSSYIRASIHVAVALISTLYITVERYQLNLPIAYYGVLFFGGIATYNVIKNLVEPGSRKGPFSSGFGWVLWMSLAAALIAFGCLLFLEYRYLIALGLTTILVVLYAVPIYPGLQNLRNYGLIKIGLVAGVWTLLTYVIPIYLSGFSINGELFLAGVHRWFWMLLLMFPFEMRDMSVDPPQLKTVPRRLGLVRTRQFGWFGAGILFALSLWINLKNPLILVIDGCAALLTGLGIQCSNPNQGPFYAAFWVEAIPIGVMLLQWVLLGQF